MAYYSISSRNGRFCCQIRWYPRDSKKRKSKNKTFNTKADARTWGKHQVYEIEKKIADGEEVLSLNTSIKTLGDLINKYLNDDAVKIGRSKRYSLKAVMDCDLALVEIMHLRPKNFVDYCKDRKLSGASPATISCDISHIRAVLRSAKPLYDINIKEASIVEAMPTLHILKLISKSNIRTRRPTNYEIEALRNELRERERHKYTIIPYSDILDFSILSCMRIGEVCNLEWQDLNIEESWIWVRDRKDPRKKVGNHMKVPLLGGSLEIIKRQKTKNNPRIFPYNPKSVSTGFQRARNKLGIEDLRYHDLRREGASRLIEQGFEITKVAQVTGHKDLNTLWRIYTDLQPSDF